MNRLFTFQNACLESVEPGVHNFDRWMIRFLIEHALPLHGEPPELAAAVKSNDAGLSNSNYRRIHRRGVTTRSMLLGLLDNR